MTDFIAVYRSVALSLTNLCVQNVEFSIQMALLPLAFNKSLGKAVAILTCAKHSPEMSSQSIYTLSKIYFLVILPKMDLTNNLYSKNIT